MAARMANTMTQLYIARNLPRRCGFRPFFCAVACALSVLAPWQAPASDTPPGGSAGPSAPTLLTWTVAPARAEILVGEPLYLRIHVRADPDRTVELALRPYWDDSLRLVITRLHEAPLRYGGPGEAAMAPEVRYALDPGEAREIRPLQRCVLLKAADTHSGAGLVFSEPTEALVQLAILCKVNDVSAVYGSDPLLVRVVAPSRADDRAVLAALMANQGLQMALQTGDCEDETLLGDLDLLLSEYPESTYSPYLALALMNGLSARSTREAEVFRAGLEKALEIAGQMENDLGRFFLMDEILFRQAVCHDRLGRPDQAMERLQRLQERFPHSGLILENHPLIRKYLFRLESAQSPNLWTLQAYRPRFDGASHNRWPHP